MTDGSGPLAALRDAVARLDDLHGSPTPGDSDVASLPPDDSDATSLPPHGSDATSLPSSEGAATPRDGFDPVEHATRFGALHDALVAVLAEVEQTGQAGQAGQADQHHRTRA